MRLSDCYLASVRVLVIVLGLHVGGFSPSPASAETCRMPTSVFNLVSSILMLPEEGDVPQSQINLVSSYLNRIDRHEVITVMNMKGMDGASPVLKQVFEKADHVIEHRHILPKDRLHETIFELQHRVLLVCNPGVSTGFQETQQSRWTAVFRGEEINWDEVERLLREDKVVSGGALMIALALFALIIYLGDLAFSWYMSFKYNRKVCRITAYLEFGSLRFDGQVVTLGRGGFRFHPWEPDRLAQGIPDKSDAPVEIVLPDLEDLRLVGWIRKKHETTADFALDERLSLWEQRNILTHSKITPYSARKQRNGGHDVTDNVAQSDGNLT